MNLMMNKMPAANLTPGEALGDRVDHISQANILNHHDRGFLEINRRGAKQIKERVRVPHHLHSEKILFGGLLEVLSLIHLAHQDSIDALLLKKKMFAISATVKGILKLIVAAVNHLDLVLIQEETVHKQTRKKKEIIKKVLFLIVFT